MDRDFTQGLETSVDEQAAEVKVSSVIDGAALGSYRFAGPASVEQALEAAARAFEAARNSLPSARSKLLSGAAADLGKEAGKLADLVSHETGKPISLAQAEVKTAQGLLATGAKEALRNRSIIEPLFVPLGSLQRMNMIRRYPRGVVLSSVPFTSPISSAANLIAAAVASGATLILRPPRNATLSILTFESVIRNALGNGGLLSVLPMDYALFESMLLDKRVAMLSYSGSKEMGLQLGQRAGGKHVVLNVGGDATAIVLSDCDIKHAASCIGRGAFANAGQASLAIENVLVHERIYPQFRDRISSFAEMDGLIGDPMDPKTLIGPMKDEGAARRLCAWVSDAKAAGGRIVAGESCSGIKFPATVIEAVPVSFLKENPRPMGPVLVMSAIESLESAVDFMHELGQDFIAAVFSRDQDDGLYCLNNLRVGTIFMNEYPLEIEDGILYYSNCLHGGAAGIRFAIEEMTVPRGMLFNNYWGT